MNIWQLPTTAVIGGKTYDLHTDYRDILEIFTYLEDPDLLPWLRWQIALGLFYEQPIPQPAVGEAIDYLCRFIRCGEQESPAGARLLDWQQDAQMIIADINGVANREIRSLPYLHWWTFMAYFHAIREGQLSTVIAIRQKLSKGKKLESWEQTYYRENRQRVDLPKRYSRQEIAERERLSQLLGTTKRQVKQCY